MLSMILLEADANKAALSDADDAPLGHVPVLGDLLAVDTHAPLLEQPPGVAGALREACLEQHRDQVGAARREVGDLARRLAAANPPLPLRLGLGRRMRAVEPLDESPGDGSLRIARIV